MTKNDHYIEGIVLIKVVVKILLNGFLLRETSENDYLSFEIHTHIISRS